MAYTTIDDPSAFFQTMLHAEDDTAFTFDGNSDLQPDMIWNKNRDENNYHHHIVDSVRGVSKLLRVSATIAEFTSADSITAIGSDGFTTGADDNGYVSSGTDKQVSWCWKTGTSFSNDASATSVGSIDSAGSVNTTAGFSIITYTGTGSVGTIAHGLGVVPSMYILKRRAGSTENWPVYHKSVGNTHALYLNTTDAKYDYANFTNDTSPTSSVFTVGGSNDQANPDGSTMIAYCFAEKKGYSKFGSYEGNANADGTFVHLGFKPAFLITKPIDAADNWNMFDNKRLAFNSATSPFAITSNTADLETTDTHQLDFLSNGFKINNSGNTVNRASTFIYWAFAESPFVTSTGIPTTAR
jgi:hypothetical protein